MNLDTPVTHIMIADPITVDIGQGIADARRALSTERFHHLPVLERGKLVGIISLTDLLRHSVADDQGPTTRFVEQHLTMTDLMQPQPVTVSHRASVGEAARLLSAGGFHALPVIDEHEHLRGLVTSTDVIAFMLEAPPARELPGDIDQRLKLLEQVFKAAEMFLHSGLAQGNARQPSRQFLPGLRRRCVPDQER